MISSLCNYDIIVCHHYVIVTSLQVYAANSNQQTESEEQCIGLDTNCGEDYAIACNTYCWSNGYALLILNYTEIIKPTSINPTATPTTVTTHSKKSSVTKVATLVATLSSSAVLLLLIIIIVVLLICRGYLFKRSSIYIPMREEVSLSPSPVTSATVFIINCPQSSDEDLRLVRNLCHNLSDHSIESITYEYSMFESGPGQSGIYHWMENNFAKCDMILFVCNKSLCDAWNSNETEQDTVVSASKQLLQGHLASNSVNNSKLAVVLLREHDQQYIPSLYLKTLSTFVVFSNGHCDEENLVRYILQVPRYIRPAPVQDVIPAVTQHITVLTENVV